MDKLKTPHVTLCYRRQLVKFVCRVEKGKSFDAIYFVTSVGINLSQRVTSVQYDQESLTPGSILIN